jgi:diguanylate cyclase (GGDEF)-like protein/PAS domain S-box-containing protein
MTGFTKEEAIGNSPRILQGPNTQKDQLDQIKQALDSWKPIRVELINYKKDGSEFWMELDITPIADSTGWYTHWVAIERDITERKIAENKIEQLAFYDSLTELPNRRLLIDRLKHQLVTVSRSQEHGALFFIDLDNFKNLNDSLGHDIGDLLLVQVAQRLTQSIRKSDTASRFGGDEFVLMLPNLSEIHQEAVNQTNIIGNKLLTAFAQPFLLKGSDYFITPSIGVTLFNHENEDVVNIIKNADLAMYQAKATGKNTICFFSSLLQETVTKRSTLESELRLALDQEQFALHYQPQITLETPFGVEALVRWQHPMLGMVSPAEFIPIAEECGLIIPLGIWILKSACNQLVMWSKIKELSEMTIAVNVSVRQFSHISFIDDIKKVINDTNVDPSKLKLELTESILVSNTEEAINKINLLRAMGIGFALDDFGIGYSSLSYLKQLPLDQIKIDQSFVRDILIDSDDATIAISIIRLAQSLNIDVIAEGVETKGQLDFLKMHGCEKYQGYLFSKPLPIHQCEVFLLEKLGKE